MTTQRLPGPVQGLTGVIEVPASKSLTNRGLIAAAVAGGGRIVNPLVCGDTRILATALADAGWSVVWDDEVVLGPRVIPDHRVRLDLEESGTGARLILGLLAASPGRALVDGRARLRQRPMQPLVQALTTLGADLDARDGFLPIRVDGRKLQGGAVEIRPEVSSQFVSSLLLAAPLMAKGLEVTVLGELPSGPYLDLTMDVLQAFGATVSGSRDRRSWRVGNGDLRAVTFEVEGDWSAAAFPLAAVAVAGGSVTLGPLDPSSRQGDRSVVQVLVGAGMEVEWNGHQATATGPVTRPLEANLDQAPDLFPALAAIAACGPPGSRFSGLSHLAHKESDRLTVMMQNLEGLGAEFLFDGAMLEIKNGVTTKANSVRSVTAAGDHRVAMAMAVTALTAGPLEVDDRDCVGKSFPGFWEIWQELTEMEEG